MNPDQQPINSMRDDDYDYTVLGRLDKLASKLIAIEAQNAEILALLQKRKRKPRASSPAVYSEHFNIIWGFYPKRAGSNPKDKAFIAYRKRISEGADIQDLTGGVHLYRAFCDATGKSGTELVMQAARFFGPNREFENDWDIPKPKADPYAKPEIFSQSHQQVDTNTIGRGDADLDESQHPYGDMK